MSPSLILHYALGYRKDIQPMQKPHAISPQRFSVVIYYVMSGTSGDDAIKEVRRGLHPNHSNPTRRFARETTSAGARRNPRRDDSGERRQMCYHE